MFITPILTLGGVNVRIIVELLPGGPQSLGLLFRPWINLEM